MRGGGYWKVCVCFILLIFCHFHTSSIVISSISLQLLSQLYCTPPLWRSYICSKIILILNQSWIIPQQKISVASQSIILWVLWLCFSFIHISRNQNPGGSVSFAKILCYLPTNMLAMAKWWWMQLMKWPVVSIMKAWSQVFNWVILHFSSIIKSNWYRFRSKDNPTPSSDSLGNNGTQMHWKWNQTAQVNERFV